MKVHFLKDHDGYEQGDIVELPDEKAKLFVKEYIVELVQKPEMQEAPAKRGRAK